MINDGRKSCLDVQDQLREVEEAKSVAETRLQAQLQSAQAEAAAVRADLTERIRSLLAETSTLEVHHS